MADTGDPLAQFFAAKCYDCGVGAPENKTEAARLFLAAADQGHALAMFNLAVCHDNGEGVPEDKSEAVRWYRAAADCGLVDAVFNLGICYSLGEGVAEDSAEAFRLYRAAADAGHAGALYNLGVCYANGFGVEADESEAIRCYRAAADLGDADAIARLQLYGRDVEGGSVDTPENRTLTEEIASQFVANNEAVDLSAFTAIEDNAAALLANYRFEVFGAYLSLDGLKSLSAFSAAALASHDGDLSLCGLDTLSPEIAATLAKHTHRLQLGGLASLSDEAAEALALHRPTSVRFRLQTRPTLSVGGYNGECELTPRGLRALAMYSGCIELSCDFNDKSEDPEWAEPLRMFHARQDQRLFKNFSSRILELLERKEVSGLQELADWTFSEAYGKSPWEVFDEFKDLMSACGNRTVWLHVFDEDDEPKPFYLFVGDEDALVRRIVTLPDKT